jgi:beta-lactamase regulating signal transducer with metallopeptidase domain/biopolymer transport protein ExbD
MIAIINQWGRVWLSFFGLAVLQNTVFLAVILVVLHLLRGRAAGLLYSLCVVGLLKLMLPPFVPLRIGMTSVDRSLVTGIVGTVTQGPAATVPAATSGLGVGLSLPGLLLMVWVTFLAAYLTLSAVSTLRLRRALAGASKVTIGATGMANLRSDVGIYRSDRIAMPLTQGFLSRSIFVPEAWDTWTERCRRMVIRHELAHIRRCDGLFQTFEVVVQAVYFFNPLVWLLSRRMNRYREMACDDEAVAGPDGDPVEYSKYLVEIAEASMRRHVPRGLASALIRQRNGLLNRIEYQMKEAKMGRIALRKRVVLLAGLILLVLPLSWYCSKSGPEGHADAAGGGVRSENAKALRKIEVAIESGHELKVDGVETQLENLAQTLKEKTADTKEEIIVLITGGTDIPMDAIRSVQEILVALDLRKVIFADGLHPDLPLVLPSEEDKAKLARIPEHNIAFLRLLPGGKVALDKEWIDLSDLKAALEQKLADNDKLILHIHSVGGSYYPDFFKVLGIAKEAGATRISFD